MAKAIFPRMEMAEIISTLSGWGFPVSQPQLLHPTPDFVESVYFACLQQVTELNQESLKEPVQSALDAAQLEDRVRTVLSGARTINLIGQVARTSTRMLSPRISCYIICMVVFI